MSSITRAFKAALLARLSTKRLFMALFVLRSLPMAKRQPKKSRTDRAIETLTNSEFHEIHDIHFVIRLLGEIMPLLSTLSDAVARNSASVAALNTKVDAALAKLAAAPSEADQQAAADALNQASDALDAEAAKL